MDISVVVPVYNEKESINQLYDEICTNLKSLDKTFEIIFIDDGSTDGVFDVLNVLVDEASGKNINIVCLKHRNNFGKAEALQTAFCEVKGDIIITMDGDLQDDPSEIENLILKIEDGYDMVSGWKKDRKDPIDKTWPSKIFNFFASKFVKGEIHDINCGFKAYRKVVVEDLVVYGDMHRYIPLLVSGLGYKIGEVAINHRKRKYGKSKYGIDRIFAFYDFITVVFLTKYSNKPLHFMGNFGLFFISVGILIITTLYLRKFIFGIFIVNNQFLFFLGLISVIIGAQFFCIGLLGELIRNISPKKKAGKHVNKKISS